MFREVAQSIGRSFNIRMKSFLQGFEFEKGTIL